MTEHQPVELELHHSDCGMGVCEHAFGECPVAGHVVACDACTFDDVDLGLVDCVRPTPWPCGRHLSAVGP